MTPEDEWCMRYVLMFGPHQAWSSEAIEGELDFISAMGAALHISNVRVLSYLRERTSPPAGSSVFDPQTMVDP